MVTCTVHAPDGTQVGSALKVRAQDRSEWRGRAGEDGLATAIVVADATAAQLAETRIVRINDGTSDVFAFIPTEKTAVAADAQGNVIEHELSGPGVRWVMRAGQVVQEDTTDCALPADSRWLGWMSGAFDDTGWPFAVSHGTWRSNPWPTVRPEGWPVPLAQYIWSATGDVPVGNVYFRRQFEVTEEADFVVCASADDEFRLWLDGTELLSTIGRGPFQWAGFEQIPVTLCPGTHTIAVQGVNLERPYGTSPAWIMVAVAEAAGDGKPAAANHVSAWSTDAESGTFTVQETSVGTSITVDITDTLTELQAKLDTAVGAGNTTVSGAGTAAKNDAYDWWIDATGGTYRITVDGEFTDVAHNATAATIEAAVEALSTVTEVTVTGAGTEADQFRLGFVGADGEQSFSVSFSGANLTGGGSAVHDTQVSEGTPYDPWLVEGVGAYANTFMHWYIDDQSALVGGDLTIETETRGDSASSVVRTDTSWTVEAYPTIEPGLTVGEILRILIAEATARGVSILSNVTLGCTDTHDSDGTAWGFGMTFEVPLPADIRRVIEVIENAGGFDVWMDPDLTLHASQERGDTLALTLTAWTESCANVRATSDETAVANVIRTRSDEGWSEVPDTDSIAARGRWESDLLFDEYRTKLGAEGAAQIALNDVATPQRRTTFEVPSGAATVPHVAYQIGDRPMGPAFGTAGMESARMRIDTIAGRIVEDDIDWTVEMVD